MRAVDRSFDDIFRDIAIVPLKIENEKRAWTGQRLDFSFTARMGFLSSPIKGYVDVTDKDLTIEADLGLLERLLGQGTRAAIENHTRKLLT
jgi:hypothetical protein